MPDAPPAVVTDRMTDLIDSFLAGAVPMELPADSFVPRGKYCSAVHADLCRMKLLGLTDAEAAKSIGIKPSTLRHWRTIHPKLDFDMDRWSDLANAEAAKFLRELMKGKDATAFNAIKFFLTTHSEAFRETQRIEVSVGIAKTVQDIRSGLYGLPSGGVPPETPGGTEDGDFSGELPVLEPGPPENEPNSGPVDAVAAVPAAEVEDIASKVAAGPVEPIPSSPSAPETITWDDL